MPGTPDLTEATPVRRLAVVRATLRKGPSGEPALGLAAASMAVKQAAAILPLEPSAHATHVDLMIDGDTMTVTVQGYARQELADAALLGLSAAALAMGVQEMADVYVVQSH